MLFLSIDIVFTMGWDAVPLQAADIDTIFILSSCDRKALWMNTLGQVVCCFDWLRTDICTIYAHTFNFIFSV